MSHASATLLSWITAEVDQALARVREQIARFLQDGDAAALQACAGHLHQVAGALRMVGLAGATRFCEAIESAFASPAGAAPGRAALQTIDRAIQALKDFVHGLGRGQPNLPLRLFPVYRELAQLRGRVDVSERDLFFPDLTHRAPPHSQPKTLGKEALPEYLQAQRGQFQRGLLAWLRGEPGGIGQMRHALDGLHRIADQLPEPQAVWWVAAGLLEALDGAADPEWLAAAKALGNRIDRQMREGLDTVNESLLCDLLYAIARSKASSPLVEDIRQLYQLDSLFAESAGPRSDPKGQTGALLLRADLVKDVVGSLQQVEQVLDAFARGLAKRDALPALQPKLQQINSALLMLRFEKAARVLGLCERLIDQCAAPEYAGVSEELDWIAEGLSSIGMFLAPCLQAREPAGHAIELFVRRYNKAQTPLVERGLDTTIVLSASAIKKATAGSSSAPRPMAVAPERSQQVAAQPRAEPTREAVDAGTLAGFLEDAGEVLGRIEAGLAQSRAQPYDSETLAGIRRGFHTLKGRSRMAGLMDLGEVAWEVEQVMNRWLQKNWPVSADLARLIDRARAAFAGRVGELREGAFTGEIDARDIVVLAARLRALETPPEAAAGPAEETRRAREPSLAGLRESIARLRGQLREFEIEAESLVRARNAAMAEGKRELDPLESERYARLQELVRLMAECLRDADAVQQSLHRSLAETDPDRTQQAAASRSPA